MSKICFANIQNFAKVSHNDPAHNACGAHRCVTFPLYGGVSHNEGRQEAHKADGRGTLWRNSIYTLLGWIRPVF